MIVILKPNVSEARRDQLISWFKAQNLGVHISQGDYQTVLGLIGDTKSVDMDLIASLDIVDAVRRVSDPFKCCNRKFHPDDTIVDVSGVKIGGGNFAMIAGPCSVESEEQIVGVANDVKKAGAKLLRGGAFKPRTSPYDFQGLKAEGLRLLSVAKKETGLPIVTEIMDVRHLDLFEDVDLIQVGARNMQNFDLLKELGKTKKPILLKRGIAATMKELLMSPSTSWQAATSRLSSASAASAPTRATPETHSISPPFRCSMSFRIFPSSSTPATRPVLPVS